MAYDPLEPTQVLAGIGNYKGKTAAALGVSHYANEATMFHAGVTLGEEDMMVNAGISRKFGWSEEKKHIPDRYKGGPISSVYVMQDEMTALKAENEKLKEQVQDIPKLQEEVKEVPKLRSELEEMKALLQQLLHKQG